MFDSFHHYCRYAPFPLPLRSLNNKEQSENLKQGYSERARGFLAWCGLWPLGRLCHVDLSWATNFVENLSQRMDVPYLSRRSPESSRWLPALLQPQLACAVVGTVPRDLQQLVPIAALRGHYCHCPRFTMVESEGWRGLSPLFPMITQPVSRGARI